MRRGTRSFLSHGRATRSAATTTSTPSALGASRSSSQPRSGGFWRHLGTYCRSRARRDTPPTHASPAWCIQVMRSSSLRHGFTRPRFLRRAAASARCLSRSVRLRQLEPRPFWRPFDPIGACVPVVADTSDFPWYGSLRGASGSPAEFSPFGFHLCTTGVIFNRTGEADQPLLLNTTGWFARSAAWEYFYRDAH